MASMWRLGGLGWKEILRRLWRQFQKDRVLDQSAMLSFYFLLSLFPFLIFLVALLGFFLQSGDSVYHAIQEYVTKIAPSSASGLIDNTLNQIRRGSSGGALSLSLLFSLWIASNGVVAIIEALNVAYEVQESRPWWKQRLVALGITIGLVLFFAAALVVLGYGGSISQWAGRSMALTGAWAVGWSVLERLMLLGFVLMAFNLLYIFAPNVKHHRWHWLMPGTVLGVALWLAASFGFKLYLKYFNTYNFTYGSIAAVIILLLWFYLSGIAILIGGELNCEIEKQSGKVEKPRA